MVENLYLIFQYQKLFFINSFKTDHPKLIYYRSHISWCLFIEIYIDIYLKLNRNYEKVIRFLLVVILVSFFRINKIKKCIINENVFNKNIYTCKK